MSSSQQAPQTQPSLEQILVAIQHLQQENQNLQNSLTQLQNATQRPVQVRLPAPTPEPRISLPERFDGTRSQFRGFVNQLRLLFCLQPNHYPTGTSQVGLIGSLLSGAALAWFAPLVEKQSPLLDDLDDFVREFQATFGEADRTCTATTKICVLRQGSQPASAYVSEIWHLACDLNWGESALIDQFRFGL